MTRALAGGSVPGAILPRRDYRSSQPQGNTSSKPDSRASMGRKISEPGKDIQLGIPCPTGRASDVGDGGGATDTPQFGKGK